jgi:uncharacterized protein
VADSVVTDNPGRSRFEISFDGELAGFAEYHAVGGNLDFTHTEVDDKFEGHGLGSKLIGGALDAARERGAGVLPHCPFVRRFIERHENYVDLVPENRRIEFGLKA